MGMESTSQKMPTGITSLDPILDGGVPQGSVILHLGDLGGGNYEFAHSSMAHILGLTKSGIPEGAVLPEEVRYITFTRVKENIKQEILLSFKIDGLREKIDSVQFSDLSEHYFDNSLVPDAWYSHGDIISRLQKRSEHDSILLTLANLIDTIKPGSLVIFDSITEIAPQVNGTEDWQNLTGFLRGLQRISKQRNITSYLLLSRGILEPSKESELADIADAVLLFRWEDTAGARRQRIMYFEKFRGVMPHLEERDLVKFAVRITTLEGFEVSNIRVII